MWKLFRLLLNERQWWIQPVGITLRLQIGIQGNDIRCLAVIGIVNLAHHLQTAVRPQRNHHQWIAEFIKVRADKTRQLTSVNDNIQFDQSIVIEVQPEAGTPNGRECSGQCLRTQNLATLSRIKNRIGLRTAMILPLRA